MSPLQNVSLSASGSTPEATPEKKEEEKETEDTVLEEKKEEPPKRRPPVGGVGIMGGPMNVNLFSEMKTNKRFSTLVSAYWGEVGTIFKLESGNTLF